MNLNKFLQTDDDGLMGDRIASLPPNPIVFSGVTGEFASCPKSSDRNSIEYAAALSSLPSLPCAMLAPEGDRSRRAKPVKFELDRLGMNLSLYDVRVGDEVLPAPMLFKDLFTGDSGDCPCHVRRAIVSRCRVSRDMLEGKLSERAAPTPRLCCPSPLSLLDTPSIVSSTWHSPVYALNCAGEVLYPKRT